MKRIIVLFVVIALLTLGIFSPRASVSAATEVPVKFYLNGEGVYTPADNIEVTLTYDAGMENIQAIRGGLFNSQDLFLAGYPLYGKNNTTVKIPSSYLTRVWNRYGNREYQLLLSVAMKDGTAVSYKKTVFISDNIVQFFFVQCCPQEDRANFPLGTYALSSISKIKEELRRPYDGGYDGTVAMIDGKSTVYHGKATGCLSAVYTYYTKTADGYRVKIRFSQWLAQGRPSQALLDMYINGAVERYKKGEILYNLCNPGQVLYGSGQISMWVWPPTKK
jgi:hypothetical protein